MEKRTVNLRSIVWMMGGLYLLASCTVNKQTATLKLFAQGGCEMDSSRTSGYVFHPLEIVSGSADDSLLRHQFSGRSLRIAQAMGLTPLLVSLTTSEQNRRASVGASNENLLIRQQITDQIQLANFDVASAAAVLDCDAKRATQTADLLTRQENTRVKKLTIVAITVGAITALAGGLLAIHDLGHSGDYVDVAGGLTEAGLGLSVFWISPYKASYRHPHNALEEIWNRKRTSTIFPPIVWYYLNHPLLNQTAVVDQLRARWDVLIRDESRKKRHKHLNANYFGEGDEYTAEALTVRANMLGQLEAEVRLMNTDLTILLNELVSHSAKR